MTAKATPAQREVLERLMRQLPLRSRCLPEQLPINDEAITPDTREDAPND